MLLRSLHREVVDGKHGRQNGRRRLATAQLPVKLKVVLVAGALAREQKIAEHLGEAVRLAQRLPAAEVLFVQGVLLERRPPGVDGPQVGLVVHQSLKAGRQPFHPGHRRPVNLTHVDLRVPAVGREVRVVGGHKLPEVAVRRQQEDGIELLADAERAPDADAEEGEGDDKDGGLEEPGGEAF